MAAHPECPEIVFFGGEFYNGQKVSLCFKSDLNVLHDSLSAVVRRYS
jgi:hypothetical protein